MSDPNEQPQKTNPAFPSRGAKTVIIGRDPSDAPNSPGEPFLTESATLTLPWDLGDFVLTEVLAQGGMGKIFRGHRKTDPNQQVAVKIPLGADASLLDRFRNEVKILSQLKHHLIVRFVAQGEAEFLIAGRTHTLPWLAMEFVAGSSLRAALR